MSENTAQYSEEYMNKMGEALDDKSFTDQLKGVRDEDGIRALFAQRDLTIDDHIMSALQGKIQYYDDHGELDEETLEMVSGGMKMSFKERFWGSVGVGLLVGACCGNPWVGLAAGIACFIVSYII